MSHNISYRTYPEKCDRKAVRSDIDHYVSMEDRQEGCRGLYHPIRWLDSVSPLADSDAAEEYIESHDRGDYDNLAVRFYEAATPAKASKGAEAAAEQVRKAQDSYNDLKVKVQARFFGTKSEMIGCKECGSRLAKKYLKKTNCPLCGRNLLSDTDTDRLQKAHNRIVKAQQVQRSALENDRQRAIKQQKNRKVKWLLKFEYHT